MIDPSADRSVARQLADLLRAQIASGQLPPGARLIAEHRMAQEHGIGRDSVRRAIAILRAEGLVETEAPYGTRVRPHVLRTEIVVPRSAVLTARMPTPRERQDLSIAEGVPVVEVTQRRGPRTVYPADRHVFRND